MPKKKSTKSKFRKWLNLKKSQKKLTRSKSKKWLGKKLKEEKNEEILYKEISENRIERPSKITTKEMATIIFQTGRKSLALKFLEETEIFEQIQTLLDWSENTKAFYKAVENGNPDYIHKVMLKLRERMSFDDFLKTIKNFPVALNLYRKYCKIVNMQILYEICIREKDFDTQALIFVQKASNKQTHVKDSVLIAAMEAYKTAKNDTNASLCEEQLKLLNFQKTLNENHPEHDFIGKTAQETCLLLLKIDEKMAEKFRTDFEIPERRFCLLKIETLARLGKWSNLEELSKRCPLGFGSFVDVCLRNNKREEALKYLPKVEDSLKIKYYVKVGYLEKAAKKAFRENDCFSLRIIRSLCEPKSSLMEMVDNFTSTLDKPFWQPW